MKKLKKIVFKLPLDPNYRNFLTMLRRYELIQIYRLDENYIFATQKFTFKEAQMHPKNLKGSYGIEFIEILAEDKQKNEYICFVKHRWPKELHLFFSNPEIMIEPPIIMEDNCIIITFISHGKHIDEIIEKHKNTYDNHFKILSITSVHPNKDNLHHLLTERQKEIAYYAVEKGYYEIPRKIDTGSLANHFGISKSALCEHLRKVERTIFFSIFK